jgi:CheY-like chemotaxis protein
MAHCDRTSVERVLSNLLSNAIAHSGGKLVHFEVSHPAPNLLSFTITDQGQGIPPDIAERTNRGSSDKKALPAWKDRTGRGLGLTIAQTLSQRMGATLWLGSAPDGGCMAKLLLPISLAQPAAQPAAAVLDLHGQRVLIAEDSTPQLLLLAQYLCDTGANITMVRDGVAAETALLAGGFDLALLDLELPGRTGLEICTALRTKMAKPPRILVLTAHTDPAIHQSARAAGASQVLVKPITSASALALALADPKAKQPQAQDGAIGLAKLLEIAGPDLAEELLARFDEDLSSVQSQLAAALPRMDWQGLRKASHVLIALAGTAGMTQLEHSARAFNSAANESNSAAVSTEAPAVMDGLAKLLALVVRMAQDRQGAV